MTTHEVGRHSEADPSDERAAELLEVVREANRLAREGGTPDERAAFHERKAALLVALTDPAA
jgi:hypothetical protein